VTLDFFGFIGAHQSFTLRHYVIDNDPDQDTRDLSTLVNAVAAGELRPVIGHTAPSRDAAAALAGLAERTTLGKTILTVGLT
jgi:NADPH:quinone reductase-like Zn-dependent oxidoreductase